MVPNRRTKGKKQKPGFPIKDFGNDKKRRSSTLKASIIPLSLIPEGLYQESKLFKGKSIWIPTFEPFLSCP